MAEVAAVSAARAATARNEARDLREQRQQQQRDLDAIRQQQIDRREREIADQRAARQRRLEDVRGDRRSEDRLQRSLEAREDSRVEFLADEAFFDNQAQTLEELDRAEERDVITTLPPLRESEVVGSVRTPQEIADARAFGAPERPEPFGLPPLAEPPAPPADRFGTGLGGVTSEEGVAAVESLDDGPEAVPFEALERERGQRLADRRDAERDSEIRQQIDLQDANDRIANARRDPDAPPGTIVDVFG